MIFKHLYKGTLVRSILQKHGEMDHKFVNHILGNINLFIICHGKALPTKNPKLSVQKCKLSSFSSNSLLKGILQHSANWIFEHCIYTSKNERLS